MMNISQGIQYTKKLYIEDAGPRKIKSLQFSMLSDSEIMKAAEIQVWKGQYYDSTRKPIENGLLDPHMGPANKSCVCATCHGGYSDCPGHYGYVTLALPVFNVGYLSTILDILKCICKLCSRVLLEEKLYQETLKKMRSPKIDALRKCELMKLVVKKCSSMASSNKAARCSKCGHVNGTVKKAMNVFWIIHDSPKIGDASLEECKRALSSRESTGGISKVNMFTPLTVLSLFKRMRDEDCELLNLSDRPEKLIITNIAVPPIPIRPSVIIDGSQSNENDITERLKGIIQANAGLSKELQETSSAYNFTASWEHLQIEVAQYINSDVRGLPQMIQPTKTLGGFLQRLKGKHGRFRGNLSGKRVEYTGRTVISPDPNLKITEVAIPIQMARILTYPERVSQHNIEKLRQCVCNGPGKYPGAFQVREHGGEKWHLGGGYRKRIADKLKFGDIVDRHLEDGDVVLFNRQPSLHRMSIMSHRVRVMPWRTLRFNESVCNPYNADFDGDEMNMHVPQTEEARTEALTLMGVQNNLCTPKNGEILVAPTQDFLTSSFLITRKDTFYDRSAFSLMCSYMGDGMDAIDLPTPTIIKPIELWTGKQLFSVLVRPHAGMRVYVNLTMKEKNYVKPKEGEREVETMCPNDGFVYFRNSELISGQLGKVTLGNGNKDGLYSVLLRDYNAHAAASCMNRLAKLSARWIGNHGFSIGIDDVQPANTLNEKRMDTIVACFRKCDQLLLPFKGKLKAEPEDVQIKLENDVTKELNEVRDRIGKVLMETLHWRNSPKIMSQCGSKGSPMNISQMIGCVGQQSVGGRRVSDGFIGRGLPHFPSKSTTPEAKGFVVNSFYSGLKATEFFFHTMGGREGLVDTAVKTADTGYMSRRLMKALEDLFIHYDNTVRNANGCIVQFLYGDDSMDPATMEGESGFPLNFDRLFLKVKATCPAREDKYLSAFEMSEVVRRRITGPEMDHAKGYSVAFKKSLENFLNKRIEILNKTRNNLGLVENHVAQENSEILEDIARKISGITSKQLEAFFNTCINRHCLKKVEAGTSIGAIGAQSIGEPGTQMTLKTFHFAGVASMNVTLGVPRIKEIIGGSKNIKTPIITAMLESDDSKTFAEMVKRRIQITTLGQVAKSIKAEYTPRLGSIRITLDTRKIQQLNLSIDAYDVKRSIIQTPRIKLKDPDIKVLRDTKLEVISQNIYKHNTLKEVLKTVIVKGLKTAKCAAVDEDKRRQKYKVLVEVLEGKGLLAVMGTEGVDGRKTKCNHVMEVQRTLGIEAARMCIIEEIKFVMKEMRIDIRHMMLLADAMTYRGEVLGITRFGIQKMDKSVLMLASFEKTGDHLFNASVSGRDDKIEGVSECIIMGIPIPIGTGILKVKQRNIVKVPHNVQENGIRDSDRPGDIKIQEINLKCRPDPIIC